MDLFISLICLILFCFSQMDKKNFGRILRNNFKKKNNVRVQRWTRGTGLRRPRSG
jgi:hypothetical protein